MDFGAGVFHNATAVHDDFGRSTNKSNHKQVIGSNGQAALDHIAQRLMLDKSSKYTLGQAGTVDHPYENLHIAVGDPLVMDTLDVQQTYAGAPMASELNDGFDASAATHDQLKVFASFDMLNISVPAGGTSLRPMTQHEFEERYRFVCYSATNWAYKEPNQLGNGVGLFWVGLLSTPNHGVNTIFPGDRIVWRHPNIANWVAELKARRDAVGPHKPSAANRLQLTPERFDLRKDMYTVQKKAIEAALSLWFNTDGTENGQAIDLNSNTILAQRDPQKQAGLWMIRRDVMMLQATGCQEYANIDAIWPATATKKAQLADTMQRIYFGKDLGDKEKKDYSDAKQQATHAHMELITRTLASIGGVATHYSAPGQELRLITSGP